MARKGGLGSGVDSLLKGSVAQRQKRADIQAEQQRVAVTSASHTEVSAPSDAHTRPNPNAASTPNQATAPEPSCGSKAVSPALTELEISPSTNEDSDDSAVKPVIASSPNSGSAVEISINGGSQALRLLPVEKIRRGTYQPRQHFDKPALQELAESLKEQGMVQPVLVRPFAGGYELIAGERRWRAAQLAGMAEIPAIVREMEDQSVAAVSLIENIQRKDLNPVEEARALQRLQSEFGMTHEDVAVAIGRSRTAVTNLLRLLDLNEEVKLLLDKGELDMGHARALLGLDSNQQLAMAQQVIDKGLSVRATEHMVRAAKTPSENAKTTPKKLTADPDILALERQLGDKLAAKVAISHGASGAGRLEISYNSLDELDGILQHIK